MRKKEKESETSKILSAIQGLDLRFDEHAKQIETFKTYLNDMSSCIDDILARVSKLEYSSNQSKDKNKYLQSQIDSIAKKVEEMRNGSDCISTNGKICAIRKEPLYDYAEQIGLNRHDVLNILEEIGVLWKQCADSRTSVVKIPNTYRTVRALKIYFE